MAIYTVAFRTDWPARYQAAGFFCSQRRAPPRPVRRTVPRSTMSRFIFTSESVSEGHPDKVCDYISDSILDACFEQDPMSRVACETLCKSDTVVLAGEITTNAALDYDRIVRDAVKAIGYTDGSEPFCDATLKLIPIIT